MLITFIIVSSHWLVANTLLFELRVNSLCWSIYFIIMLNLLFHRFCIYYFNTSSYLGLRWRPRLAQWHVHRSKQRRPRLVLGWVTIREDRALWTCMCPFVGVDLNLWPTVDRLYSRHRADTDVKLILKNLYYLLQVNYSGSLHTYHLYNYNNAAI